MIRGTPGASRPLDGGVHLVVNESRFPVCGSWRSNWNRTDDPARVTCPECVLRLAVPAAGVSGTGQTR